jgi:quercetin dioxygenase-like cupin family protein
MATLKVFAPKPIGEILQMGRFPLTRLLTEDETGGAYSVVEQTLPPRGLVMPHVHRDHDQLKVVLAGDCGMYLGGEEFVAPAGSIVFGPRGIPHAVWNAGPGECRFAELTSPGGFEDYFPEFAALPGGESPDLKARLELAARYGVQVLPEIGQELIAKYDLEL